MLAVERRNNIEQIINESGTVLVADLAKKFEVTPETIRADLLKLEKQGVLIRTYGGATLVENVGNDLNIAERDIVNFEEKQRIGKRAAQMIRDGETIFLDASTSAWHLARNIKEKKGLTVITNASKIAYELAECKGIHVVQTGGELNSKNMSYIGRIAERTISENYFANKMFFSCKGVTISRGLVESSEDEAQIKKNMLKNSETVIFLCDHSKMGRLAVPNVASLDDLDCFITDVDLDEEWVETLNKAEVRIITV